LEVYALVGPSGTGKSHRAVMLANRLGAEVIVDDGLIIKGNQIVAGVSAKKQPTRIGAIKTALFMDAGQMNIAREAITRLQPEKILLLGTSIGMVEKIAQRLELPAITEFIMIDQIASPKEIRKARIMRKQHSKHVIPAPTIEVKKSLPEIIIDPLQVFLKRKGLRDRRNWLEQSVVRPTFTMYGKFTISQSALGAIAAFSAKAVPGGVGVQRAHIVRSEQGIIIELDIVFGTKINISSISRDVQACVKEQVEKMTGLVVKHINITVMGLKVEEIV